MSTVLFILMISVAVTAKAIVGRVMRHSEQFPVLVDAECVRGGICANEVPGIGAYPLFHDGHTSVQQLIQLALRWLVVFHARNELFQLGKFWNMKQAERRQRMN